MESETITNLSDYSQIAKFLVAITILSRNSNKKPKNYFSLNIDSNGKVS